MADTIEIDLEEFGMSGKIVLAEPDFKRDIAINNMMLSKGIDVKDTEKIQDMSYEEKRQYIASKMSKHLETLRIIQILGYIQSAPFLDFSDEDTLPYSQFLENMTQPLFKRIESVVKANFDIKAIM